MRSAGATGSCNLAGLLQTHHPGRRRRRRKWSGGSIEIPEEKELAAETARDWGEGENIAWTHGPRLGDGTVGAVAGRQSSAAALGRRNWAKTPSGYRRRNVGQDEAPAGQQKGNIRHGSKAFGG